MKFSPKWYSHKSNGPGLRYEIGVGIHSGALVWLHGPFPCGTHSDTTIFRNNLKKKLGRNESIIADCGYTDSKCVSKFQTSNKHKFRRIRARHERVNMIFKSFKILSSVYRHNLYNHRRYTFAIANIVQMMIIHEKNSFDI